LIPAYHKLNKGTDPMTLPDSAYYDNPTQFGYRICRTLNGLWQLAGGHGKIDPQAALQDMLCYHDEGYITWDLADHYGPAEDFIGAFRKELLATRGQAALDSVRAFTKWVPRPQRITRAVVESAIDVSLRRMQVQRLDLLQFHWWDYTDHGYMDALRILADLRDAGKIQHVALTNFDTARLSEITGQGIRIVSNQVQFSIIDRRPEARMIPFCQQNNVVLLTYGTLCGGLLSEKYVKRPEPQPGTLNTASLRKYKQMIDVWGGWTLFQELLDALKAIADKHNVTIANVAVRCILDKPTVAGVIVGARLGLAEHRAENGRVFSFTLDDADRAQIEAISAKSQDLMQRIGDCGDEYRG